MNWLCSPRVIPFVVLDEFLGDDGAHGVCHYVVERRVGHGQVELHCVAIDSPDALSALALIDIRRYRSSPLFRTCPSIHAGPSASFIPLAHAIWNKPRPPRSWSRRCGNHVGAQIVGVCQSISACAIPLLATVGTAVASMCTRSTALEPLYQTKSHRHWRLPLHQRSHSPLQGQGCLAHRWSPA